MLDKQHSSISVANYLLKKDQNLSPLWLMKLVYLCHGWHLALYDAPLIDEPVIAYGDGPIFEALFDAVENYVIRHLTFPLAGDGVAKLTKQQKEMVDDAYDYYKDLDTWHVANLTHNDTTPWAKVWTKHPSGHAVIDNLLIQKHWKEKFENGKKQQKIA